MNTPTVYLAHVPVSGGKNSRMEATGLITRQDGTGGMSAQDAPPILVSYAYVQPFVRHQSRYRYRQWVLDSGAFSAHHSGMVIELDEYIAFCQERLASDPTLVEVFGLDVIGDWRASIRNVERMWEAGVPAIPTFHYGSPESALLGLARDYPKIALGGMVGLRPKAKRQFAEQCFARVFPKAIHGFGVGTEELVLGLPWHSVDATNWETMACRFGTWRSFGRSYLNIKGSQQDLRSEIRWYADLERRARHRWAREMATVSGQLRAAGWRGYEGEGVR